MENELKDKKYVENEFHEKWKRVGNDDKAYKMIDKACKCAKYSNFGIEGVCEVEGDDHYVALLHGGKNGPGEWSKYMEDMTRFFNALDVKKWWIIDVNNDCLDDVHDIRFAFRMK